jgi:hypothetical protein
MQPSRATRSSARARTRWRSTCRSTRGCARRCSRARSSARCRPRARTRASTSRTASRSSSAVPRRCVAPPRPRGVRRRRGARGVGRLGQRGQARSCPSRAIPLRNSSHAGVTKPRQRMLRVPRPGEVTSDTSTKGGDEMDDETRPRWWAHPEGCWMSYADVAAAGGSARQALALNGASPAGVRGCVAGAQGQRRSRRPRSARRSACASGSWRGVACEGAGPRPSSACAPGSGVAAGAAREAGRRQAEASARGARRRTRPASHDRSISERASSWGRRQICLAAARP